MDSSVRPFCEGRPQEAGGGTVDVGQSCGHTDCRALCSDTSSFVPTRIPRTWVFAGGVLRDGTNVLIKRSIRGPLSRPLCLCLRLPREDTASSPLSASQEEGSRQEPHRTAPCSGISSFQSCEKQGSVGSAPSLCCVALGPAE